MNTEIIEKVKGLRLRVSEAIAMIGKLDTSRETSLAYTQAQEGFMFLGKVLDFFGAEDRYPKDKDKASATIMDSVDFDAVSLPDGDSYLERVKGVRDVLQRLMSDSLWNRLLDATTDQGQSFVSHQNVGWAVVNHSLISLMASKMWLGMELNNIVRETEVPQANPPSLKEQHDPTMEKAVADHISDGKQGDAAIAEKKAEAEVAEKKDSTIDESGKVKELTVEVMKEQLKSAGVKFNNNLGDKKVIALYNETFSKQDA